MCAVYDHEGRRYPSEVAMCEAYGIAGNTFRNRVARGWDLKRALTTPVRSSGAVSDHLGAAYPTMRDMCEHWGVDAGTFRSRLRLGWTLERALTEKPPDEVAVDHEGTRFPSKASMCRHWGVRQEVVAQRLGRGWSLRDALTLPVDTSQAPGPKGSVVMDHEGREFGSVKDMCAAYGIPRTTFYERVSSGWDLMSALTIPKSTARRPVTDHEGNAFASAADMCKHWGVPYMEFSRRISAGMDVGRALTGAPKRRGRSGPWIDHEGMEFKTMRAMCEAHGVAPSVFKQRIVRGWDLERALTEPVRSPRMGDDGTSASGGLPGHCGSGGGEE